jgi:hypothetical protein
MTPFAFCILTILFTPIQIGQSQGAVYLSYHRKAEVAIPRERGAQRYGWFRAVLQLVVERLLLTRGTGEKQAW